MDKQRTLKDKVSFSGVGLHTGETTKIEIIPANPNTGIVFLRQDLNSPMLVKADFYSVVNPQNYGRRTTIGCGQTTICTIEHLMAAFHLLGIENAQVNIWGSEVPGMDGSAKEFVEGIEKIGIVEQDAPKEFLVIKEPLWAQDNSCNIVVLPDTQTKFTYVLNYDNPIIGSGIATMVIDAALVGDVWQARTFCLEEESQALLAAGLGKGANHQNTLVVSKTEIIKNKPRINDEFAKHKLLDLIGDLYLVGPFKGHVIAVRGGHGLNLKLVEKMSRLRSKARTAAVVSPDTSFVPAGSELDVTEIMKILPHRFPFLLVDRIVELEMGKRIVGIKNVTMNEHFFQGHFPGRPVMPGVLMVEAMAQVGGILMLAQPQNRGKIAFFMAANNIKFRKTVVPGDQLRMEIIPGKIRSKTGTVTGQTFVKGELVCEAELMFALVD